MAYTAEQIGPVEVREYVTRTKDRLALLVLQSNYPAPEGDDILVVASPVSWQHGRYRTLELLANGVEFSDIRFVQVPQEYAGDGQSAGDGASMKTVNEVLWWTAQDEYRWHQEDERTGQARTMAEAARDILTRDRPANWT